MDTKGTLLHSNAAVQDIVRLSRPNRGPPESWSKAYGLFASDQVTPLRTEQLPIVRAMGGESVDGAEMFLRHEGAPEGIWLSVNARPLREEGVVSGGVAVFHDVTAEKAAQAQVLAADRLASIGMLAAGVAHEISNPLAAVIANLESAARASTDADVREMIDQAREGAARVRQIARDLRMFARSDETAPGGVDVHQTLESTLRMAWTEIRYRARLVKDYGSIPLVAGSPSRLGQVFLNLIVNAAQAIPEGAVEAHRIRISTRSADGRVVVEVSDTGAGIQAELLPQLFRPFFTTKGPEVGTGLGLAISHGIVTGLGGRIEVESTVGEGTTFRVHLPIAPAPAALPEVMAGRTTGVPRRGRVLVVDDEPMMGAAIRRLLRGEHDVVVTADARAAMEGILAGQIFDVIVCDLMMADFTGMDFYAALLRHDPAAAHAIIFITAGAFTTATRAFLEQVTNVRLEKPFDSEQLRALVKQRVTAAT